MRSRGTDRLFAQIDRGLTINNLVTVTTDVVDAVRESHRHRALTFLQ
jgi:hypothetical protein